MQVGLYWCTWRVYRFIVASFTNKVQEKTKYSPFGLCKPSCFIFLANSSHLYPESSLSVGFYSYIWLNYVFLSSCEAEKQSLPALLSPPTLQSYSFFERLTPRLPTNSGTILQTDNASCNRLGRRIHWTAEWWAENGWNFPFLPKHCDRVHSWSWSGWLWLPVGSCPEWMFYRHKHTAALDITNDRGAETHQELNTGSL